MMSRWAVLTVVALAGAHAGAAVFFCLAWTTALAALAGYSEVAQLSALFAWATWQVVAWLIALPFVVATSRLRDRKIDFGATKCLVFIATALAVPGELIAMVPGVAAGGGMGELGSQLGWALGLWLCPVLFLGIASENPIAAERAWLVDKFQIVLLASASIVSGLAVAGMGPWIQVFGGLSVTGCGLMVAAFSELSECDHERYYISPVTRHLRLLMLLVAGGAPAIAPIAIAGVEPLIAIPDAWLQP